MTTRYLGRYIYKWQFTKPAAEMAETLVGTERLSSMERELREDHLANYLQLVAASVRPVAISLRPRPRPAAVSVSVRTVRPKYFQPRSKVP